VLETIYAIEYWVLWTIATVASSLVLYLIAMWVGAYCYKIFHAMQEKRGRNDPPSSCPR